MNDRLRMRYLRALYYFSIAAGFICARHCDSWWAVGAYGFGVVVGFLGATLPRQEVQDRTEASAAKRCAQRESEAESIARALADADVLIWPHSHGWRCEVCKANLTDRNALDQHATDCPLRQAREWVAERGEES